MVKLTPKNYMLIERILTWGVSPIAIPAMRFMQDPPDIRNKLFVRDFSTFTIGALMFFIPMAVAEKAFKGMAFAKVNPLRGRLAAFLVGLGFYEMFAGIGAVKLSEQFGSKPENAPEQPEIKRPRVFSEPRIVPLTQPVAKPSSKTSDMSPSAYYQPDYSGLSWMTASPAAYYATPYGYSGWY